MPNPSNSDLVGEARRLSFELRSATFPTDTKSHRAQAATMIERLVLQLEQAEQREGRYREALEPFADDYSWHHNYDGSGVIFQPPGAYYEKDVQAYLDKAKAALTPDEGADPGGR